MAMGHEREKHLRERADDVLGAFDALAPALDRRQQLTPGNLKYDELAAQLAVLLAMVKGRVVTLVSNLGPEAAGPLLEWADAWAAERAGGQSTGEVPR